MVYKSPIDLIDFELYKKILPYAAYFWMGVYLIIFLTSLMWFLRVREEGAVIGMIIGGIGVYSRAKFVYRNWQLNKAEEKENGIFNN